MRRWPALIGALGAVLAGFGFLTMLLWAAQPSLPLEWVGVQVGLGLVLLVAALLASLDSIRERLRSGASRRAGKYGTSAVLSAVATLAILGLLAVLSTRYSVRFDWSEQRVHTLSQQSREVLAGLDRDVEITALFNALDAPEVRDLLERYEVENPGVTITFVDPVERPDVVESLELADEDLSRGLVRIEVAGNTTDVRTFDEASLTQALLRLTRQSGKTVYFLEGHNERRIRGSEAPEPKGYGRAASALVNETYAVRSLLLAASGEVPDDADVVIVAGPTRILLPQEHGALDRYLARGGALFVLIDPRARTDLYDDLLRWGVRMGPDVIVDPKLALFGRSTSPFAGQYGPHPITKDLREPAVFHMARSVDLADEDVKTIETIVYSGPEAWAERDLDGWAATGRAEFGYDDAGGPVPMAVAGTARVPGGVAGRIAVFGDSDFATNEYIEGYRNRDIFLNTVNWLAGDVDAITIRPHQSRASRFQLSSEQFSAIQLLSLFALPQLIALVGVFAWWWRRHRTGS